MMTDENLGDERRRDREREIGQEIGRSIGEEVARKVAIGFALLAGFIAFIFVGGFVVQWLWNWLLPDIFELRRITFWQALGLLALCRILFGGFGKSGGSHFRDRSRRRGHWREARDEWRRRKAEPTA